jgi:hypothetical protein
VFSILPSPHPSSVQITLLITLFSNTLSLCSSLSVRDQVFARITKCKIAVVSKPKNNKKRKRIIEHAKCGEFVFVHLYAYQKHVSGIS